jgi:D-beta-D-heptose 7-phosphate kinase/D-beta-D-heptose 1-phosphate adenosyltransferase
MRDPEGKVLTLPQAAAWRQALRRCGGTLAVCNGCYDLLHFGHMQSLHLASREADCLLVLLNSDDCVTAIKGPLRPVIGETDRAYMLLSLRAVSAVVLFGSADRLDCAAELTTLRPDVYTIGEEYQGRQNAAEAAALADCGAQVVWLPRKSKVSTTELIAKLTRGQAA